VKKQPSYQLMQGNEAVAEGALAGGVNFFAGYPITPSTEIAEILADRLPAVGGKFIQMRMRSAVSRQLSAPLWAGARL
jgi:pyruvate/2-oxoacid:ferredoxin oxidoreductase alpha subunit